MSNQDKLRKLQEINKAIDQRADPLLKRAFDAIISSPYSWLIVAAILVLTFALGAGMAKADPLYVVQAADGTLITLFGEPCRINAAKNLTRRATWKEAGKSFEGCYGANALGIVMLEFDDRTVVGVPASAFTKVKDI